VSSIVPPFFLQTLISLKSQFVSCSKSVIPKTASTASGDKISRLEETTLDEREVETQSIRHSLSSNLIYLDAPFRNSIAFYKAI